jgi:hypothetical protein
LHLSNFHVSLFQQPCSLRYRSTPHTPKHARSPFLPRPCCLHTQRLLNLPSTTATRYLLQASMNLEPLNDPPASSPHSYPIVCYFKLSSSTVPSPHLYQKSRHSILFHTLLPALVFINSSPKLRYLEAPPSSHHRQVQETLRVLSFDP